jgi:hypothetical protein
VPTGGTYYSNIATQPVSHASGEGLWPGRAALEGRALMLAVNSGACVALCVGSGPDFLPNLDVAVDISCDPRWRKPLFRM